tara:strand:- start:177 stop:1118 length:942 start_codon:yes stop_codon:yes gene_type:complete
MEIEKQVFSIFSSFIRDLSKTFPEVKNCLYRNYESEITGEDLKLENCPKIKVFLSKIDENNKLISNEDIKFFEVEDILEEISFQRLWEKNISDKTKGTIWKYFKTFTIININLNSSKQLQEALQSIGNDEEIKKEDIKDKKTAKELKQLKKLTEEVKEENKDEDELDLENILGGLMDSNIGSIAKEVASSMNIEEMLGNVDQNSNPMEVMAQMMNPEKMGSIFQNINKVMEQKMESGDLSEESLKKEAQDMYGNMANNPLFGDLMGKMNEAQGAQGEQGEQEEQSSTEKELSKEEKKEKLKKKIEEKKKERSK